MKRFIWIGILYLSFVTCATAQQHSSTNISRDSQRWCRIGKSNDTVSYLCNQEIRVSDYSFFLYMMEKEYGKNSEKYRSLLPDTASFLSRYHFRFTYMEKCPDYMNRLQESLPMTCITYEQANAYCQWKESVSKKHHKYALHYSIPSKTDYESALKHAKITQFPPLSTLNQFKCKRTIHGLTDNVPEYLLNGDSTVCCNKKGELSFEPTASNETGIGFRFKVEKIRIK